MNDVSVFLIAASTTLTLSIGIAIFIRRHMRNVLVDLTGSGPRAEYWVALTSLILVLVPIIALMFVPRSRDSEVPEFFRVVDHLRWALTAMVCTLVSYAFVIIWFVQSRRPQ
jgi:hypothetical protein